MIESPNSDLSDYASDDFPDDIKARRISMEPTPDHDHARPSKRIRLMNRAPSSPPRQIAVPPLEDDAELSEDTDGSVPASPTHHPGMSQDDEYGQDQVTVCKWEGCEAGDLENMDNLVEHLHDDHIGTRQKKYSCEWSDCTRKGIPHASGYALRAHMRSHTREKPFYCTLPECDRSFTRSDALAKHMRTVHETEALRPSDPVPKHHSSNPSNNKQRIKLVLNMDGKKPEKGSTPGSPASQVPLLSGNGPSASDGDYAHNNVIYLDDIAQPGAPAMVQFPPDIDLSDRELSLPAPELFQLLRRQLQYAQDESKVLNAEVESLEKARKEEWQAKELLVENIMEAQAAKARRQQQESGELDKDEVLESIEHDVAPAKGLSIRPVNGRLPWWRETSQADPAGQPDVAMDDARPQPEGPAMNAKPDAQVA